MIQNDFFIIESIQYAVQKELAFERIKGLSSEEKAKLKPRRTQLVMAKWAMVSLGFLRSLVKNIPIEKIEEKLTVENFKNWVKEKYPELYKVFEEEGERADRWIEAEIRRDLIPWLRGQTPAKPGGEAGPSPR